MRRCERMDSKVFKTARRPWRSLLSIANARRSLSGKLMVVMLVTTAIALASAGAALMYTDLRDNRAAWAEDLRTEAAILALGVTPALSFNDREYAHAAWMRCRRANPFTPRRCMRPTAACSRKYARAGQPAPPANRPRCRATPACTSTANACWS